MNTLPADSFYKPRSKTHKTNTTVQLMPETVQTTKKQLLTNISRLRVRALSKFHRRGHGGAKARDINKSNEGNTSIPYTIHIPYPYHIYDVSVTCDI